MAENQINNLIGQYIIGPLPQNCNREYREFAIRLEKEAVDGKLDLETFISATKSDEEDRISLCTFDRTLKEVKVDSILDMVHACRSHILQVFMHPKIHLKEIQQVLPVEIVSRVGHESIKHLASHSEHWESVKVSGLVPARLLARTLEDEFAIYENVVAKNLVNKLYSKMVKKRKELKVIEYNFQAKESIYSLSNQQPNVYEAYNSLFKGYEDDSLHDIREMTEKQLKMVEDILSDLAVCRESALYGKLKRAPKIIGQLDPTNIFLMDKHYKYIYKLWKELSKAHLTDEDDDDDEKIEITDEYFKFVYSELVFALNYFNFSPKRSAPIIVNNGNLEKHEYSFADWNCSLEETWLSSLKIKGLILSTSMGVEFTFPVENIVNSDLGSLPARIDGTKLLVFKILSEKEQDRVCEALYPDIVGSNWTVKKARKALRLNLMQRFWSKFHENKISEYKVLILPIYTKFNDCSLDAKKAIGIINDAIKDEIDKLSVNACYIVTPFSPFDYEGTERLAQSDVKQLFHYTTAIINSKPEYGVLPVTIGDINSYRRFTKVILLSMISVMEEISVCPICGQLMIGDKSGVYVCYNCSYGIMKTKCQHCGKYFLNSKFPLSKVAANTGEEISYKLLVSEIEYSFKNLLDKDFETGMDICPHCKE